MVEPVAQQNNNNRHLEENMFLPFQIYFYDIPLVERKLSGKQNKEKKDLIII